MSIAGIHFLHNKYSVSTKESFTYFDACFQTCSSPNIVEVCFPSSIFVFQVLSPWIGILVLFPLEVYLLGLPENGQCKFDAKNIQFLKLNIKTSSEFRILKCFTILTTTRW